MEENSYLVVWDILLFTLIIISYYLLKLILYQK